MKFYVTNPDHDFDAPFAPMTLRGAGGMAGRRTDWGRRQSAQICQNSTAMGAPRGLRARRLQSPRCQGLVGCRGSKVT